MSNPTVTVDGQEYTKTVDGAWRSWFDGISYPEQADLWPMLDALLERDERIAVLEKQLENCEGRFDELDGELRGLSI